MDQIGRIVAATLKGGSMHEGGFIVDSREKSESDCDLNQGNSWSGDESFKKGRSWKDTKQTSGAEYLMLHLMCDTG